MKCLIKDCQQGNCSACIAARCSWCKADTRFGPSHTLDGMTFCGPHEDSACAWHYRQRTAKQLSAILRVAR